MQYIGHNRKTFHLSLCIFLPAGYTAVKISFPVAQLSFIFQSIGSNQLGNSLAGSTFADALSFPDFIKGQFRFIIYHQ